MKKELSVVYYKKDQINVAKYNPRDITDDAKKGLSSSLDKFDLLQPLIINKRDGRNILTSGHRRFEDLIEKGYDEFPCVEVDLDDEEEKLLNLTMNNLKIQGYFNDDLNDLLKSVSGADQELLESLGIKPLIDLIKDDDKYVSFMNINKPEVDYNKIDNGDWATDISKVEAVKENLDGIIAKIKITCKQEDKDQVLFYLKDKLMETSFEGVHIE